MERVNVTEYIKKNGSSFYTKLLAEEKIKISKAKSIHANRDKLIIDKNEHINKKQL